MSRGIGYIKAIFDKVISTPNYGQCLKKINIVSAENGNCTARFTVSEEHLNLGGTLHGGFTSTLVDCISTYALMTQPNGVPGVSIDLSVSFVKPAFSGDIVTVDAKTVHLGKSLAFLSVDISKNDGKVIIAQGRHTKYIAV